MLGLSVGEAKMHDWYVNALTDRSCQRLCDADFSQPGVATIS